MPEPFAPKILAFFCSWCTYVAAWLRCRAPA